jgi:hypothetical protein
LRPTLCLFPIKSGKTYSGVGNTASRDPYERRSVYVADSTIPGAGEGLFAKRDFEQRELLSYYA